MLHYSSYQFKKPEEKRWPHVKMQMEFKAKPGSDQLISTVHQLHTYTQFIYPTPFIYWPALLCNEKAPPTTPAFHVIYFKILLL